MGGSTSMAKSLASLVKTQRSIPCRLLALFLGLTTFMASCKSSSMIESEPPGAKVFFNGRKVGTTPLRIRDSKISFTQIDVRLKKEGYETLDALITKDRPNTACIVASAVGGLILLLPAIGLLWCWRWERSHTFELERGGGQSFLPDSESGSVLSSMSSWQPPLRLPLWKKRG